MIIIILSYHLMKEFIMVLKFTINLYDLINENDLKTVSEDYLNFKNYKIGSNKDYAPIEKTEHTRKKTFVYQVGRLRRCIL